MQVASPQPDAMDLRALFRSAPLRTLRARVRELDTETLEEQVSLARIPAPPFGEAERADYVHRRFVALGLAGVRSDEVGNVHGWLHPNGEEAADLPPLVVSAHLDTVFPAETPLNVRRNGGKIFIPGISDNARGLAGMLAVARVLAENPSAVERRIAFVATVGEEGIGDLRGVKHLFRDGGELRSARGFLSIDGSGLRRIVHRGVGSNRFRVVIEGPGGHSWADWGIANPVHALGAAVAELGRIEVPTTPASTLTVARCGGGTSVNAIPESSWMELDLRSEDSGVLGKIERSVRAAIRHGVQQENRRRRRRTPALRERWTTIGDRPAGTLAADDPLVELAVAATLELGVQPELAASSTDANVPLARGVPALTIGAGGESGGIHTTEEWYSNERGAAGVERALLIVVAAAAR